MMQTKQSDKKSGVSSDESEVRGSKWNEFSGEILEI